MNIGVGGRQTLESIKAVIVRRNTAKNLNLTRVRRDSRLGCMDTPDIKATEAKQP